MPNFFNRDIAELCHQLTISPRRLRFSQLSGIELLLELIEEERSYPFEFICFHITGYRKRGPQTSAVIPGKALILDLVTMAEVLSRKANLNISELDEPVLTHQEVADRLEVSTKTIRRWRSRGLLGIRVVFEDGVNRLAFFESTVERFAVRHKDLVERGASFRQLSDDERARIVERARELAQASPIKLHAAARMISEETGRAVETIRYTLRRHEEVESESLFAGHHELPERCQAIWRCRDAGEDVESIAGAFGTTVEDIEKTLRYVQLWRWQRDGLDCIHNELFDAPDADEIILDAPEPPASDAPLASPPRDTPAYLRSLYAVPLLTKAQEQDLFRRYNYLKYRTGKVLKKLEPEEASVQEFDQVRAAISAIEKLSRRIIRANLRLVVSIARKHVGWSPNFFEVISDGNMSLMRAVEKFDYARGVKFSTYASWAIMKNYARSIPEQHYHSARYVTGQDELLDAAPDHRSAAEINADRSRIRELIATGLQELSEREREIISGHFGLGQRDGALTLEQLGQRFGVTKERVRQIEMKALSRLREVLSPSLVESFTK